MTALSAPRADVSGARPAEGERTLAHVGWPGFVRVLLLLLLPCVCYAPALNGEFLWDDGVLILRNPLLGSWQGLGNIWFSTVPLDYFPLTYTSFWLEKWLWGEQPAGYHVVNLGLHVVSAFLLWRLLRALRVPGAWLSALLFAVHPVNVASVAWISERKNVLSMTFYLACLICFVRWRSRDGEMAAWRPYGAALGWFVLAALSKSSVVMLPCVMLLIVWWQDGCWRRRDLGRTAPFFAVALAAGLLTLWFQYHRAMTAESLAHAAAPAVRVLTAGRAVWFYLGKIVFPHRLAMLYPRWEISAEDPWAYLAPGGLAAVFAVLWWARRVWGRAPMVALGYFVLTLLPVSGLLTMSFFAYSDASDHLVYLSAPAVFAVVAAALSRWQAAGGVHARLALVVTTAVLGLLCLGCVARAEDFGSALNLWRATLEINPRSYAAHNNLGLAYQDRSRQDPRQLLLAEHEYRAALDAERNLAAAGVNLANVLRMEGRWAESADLYRKVLDRHPEAETFNNYGVTLLEVGDTEGARAAFYEALRFRPGMVSAYHNLIFVERIAGRFSQALAAARACLRVDPDDVTALSALVELSLNQPGQAPLPAATMAALVDTAEHACRVTQYRRAESLVLLSKSLQAAGQTEEADRMAERAAVVAIANGQSELAAAIADYRRSLGR